jgi:type VI secretion system secreted protein VgrG
MPYTQANRLASITTPLGTDKLLFKSMTGVERLGRPFEYELLLLSTDPDIDYKSIVGKSVTVKVQSPFANVTRYFNGVVRSFAQVNYSKDLSQYMAVMVPQFWFSSLTADCRIFQNKPVKDILSTIIKTDGGVSDYRDSASSTTATREYCVQYRETDFDFASRLMEEEGAYYFFEHKDGKHIFVLSDSPAAHSAATGAATVPFVTAQTPGAERQGMYSWGVRYEAKPGTYVLADYDFKNPNNVLRSNELVSRNHTGSEGEIFDYPGMFERSADGDRLAKVRLHERQARHEVYSGDTTAITLAPGTKFSLSDHPKSSYNGEYLVIENEITIENTPYRAGKEEAPDTKIRSRVMAIPSSQTFRPARVTPRPNLRGAHTAIVVGPSGEEVHTDKYGRIKVQFYWDREGKKDENSSIFIRVAQMWAGKGWGTMFIPRIGQEVVVEFLEGEPDRPIVTGCVYNEVNNAPYALPDNKTRSTIRTNSSTGGGGYNEIRFEDKKDSEQLFVHAQKDQDTRVVHDRKEWIGNDTHLYVKQDRLEQVDRDHHETITGKHIVEVGGDSHLKIKGKDAVEITGKHSLVVKDDVAEKFEKNQSTAVTGDYYIKAKNIVIEAEENITIKVGGVYIAIESGGIKIEAPKIEIKSDEMKHDISGNWEVQAGGVKLNANETKMEGSGIELNASASLNLEGGSTAVKGNSQLNLEGAMSALKASGVLTIQGSMVNIN